MEIEHIFRKTLKWWWFITLSVLVTAAAAFAVSRTLAPVYRASTSLLVRVDASTAFVGQQLAMTYKELLTKRPVLEQVARAVGQDLAEVQKNVRVELVYDTSIIQITAEAGRSTLAAEIANGIVAAFMQISRESSRIEVRDLVVVEPATPPTKPIWPRPTLNALIAAAADLILATATVLLVERQDQTLRTAQDIAHTTHAPTLAVIPRLNGHRAQPKANKRTPGIASPRTEAYRTLRARIQIPYPDGKPPLLLIASPTSDAEKADVTVRLATVFGETGCSVLVIDANLRQPYLHQAMNIPESPGLSTLPLDGVPACLERIVETGVPGLSLLPAGPPPDDPLYVLGSPQIKQVIREAQTRFDVVLLELPPILAVADAAALASQVDECQTILVIKSRHTRQPDVEQALYVLDSVRAPLLGIVLSEAKTRASRYGAYAGSQSNGHGRPPERKQ